MKKLVLAIAAVVAISFASCGGNTQNTVAEDSLAADSITEPVEVVEDSACCPCDSTCECPADSACACPAPEVAE